MISRIKNKMGRMYQSLVKRARFWKYSLKMRSLRSGQDAKYQDYLDVQLQRTLSKKSSPLRDRTRFFVDQLAAQRPPQPGDKVLSIGCRNLAEIDYLRQVGYEDVTGIDLYSEYPDIQVMDMHSMSFPDAVFDVIYSSHSLEHAYDIDKVASEIARVARPGAIIAIEVPIQFQHTLNAQKGYEVFDFENKERMLAVFDAYIDSVLGIEELPGTHVENFQTVPIIRAIFVLKK